MTKRILDISISILILLLSMPLWLLGILCVWVFDGAPVFFTQLRVGKNHKNFQLIKLRTMRSDLSGSSVTLGADARITPTGRWLRRCKIDEIPQLINVLRGEMSLVGPRPVIPELADEFAVSYAFLLQVRPGLTDPATIKYAQETELLEQQALPLDYFKRVLTPDKLRLSRHYMDQATWWRDLPVLLHTAWVLVRSLLVTLFKPLADSRICIAVARLSADALCIVQLPTLYPRRYADSAVPERPGPGRF